MCLDVHIAVTHNWEYSRSAGINILIVEGLFTIVVCGSNAEKCATNHRPCSTLEEE